MRIDNQVIEITREMALEIADIIDATEETGDSVKNIAITSVCTNGKDEIGFSITCANLRGDTFTREGIDQ